MNYTKSVIALAFATLVSGLIDSTCAARTFFSGTDHAFEWSVPEGWDVFEAEDAKKFLLDESFVAQHASVSTAYLDTVEFFIASPSPSFTSNILVRVEDKRFGYQAADLESLKRQLQVMYAIPMPSVTVETVSRQNRSDGKPFLEVVTANSSERTKRSNVTMHIAGGQLQASLTSPADAFLSDHRVLMSFLDRVPYSSYSPAQPLVDSDSPKQYLGQFIFISVTLLIYSLIVHFRRKKRPLS